MQSLQGHALVASPYLTESNFMRTVVYLIRHDDEGAMGLILNRPTSCTVGQLLGELTETEIDNDEPVFCGGPVDGPVMMLQASAVADEESTEIFLACDQSRILEIVNNDDPHILGSRLFDGYAGWGPGQLESEMSEGSWLVWDIPAECLFSECETLWQDAVVQIGRNVIADGIGHDKFCCNPDNN